MTNVPVIVPVLSTAQSADTFNYDKAIDDLKPRDHLKLRDPSDHDEVLARICEYYSLDKLSSYLMQLGPDSEFKFKNITLQFPDALICDSATIIHELQERLGLTPEQETGPQSPCDVTESCCSSTQRNGNSQRLWILADTSYSACCVDEVAAKHVESDLVVHFGDACLNVVDSLPSAYIFGKPQVDLAKIVEQFRKLFSCSENVLLMSDAPHAHALRALFDLLCHEYPHISYADLALPQSCNSVILGYAPRNSDGKRSLNRVIHSKDGASHQSLDAQLADTRLFHITQPDAPRLLQLTTKFASVTIFDPTTNTTSQGPFSNLMRRYRYMHSARTAGTIGLLVNTLSLANTRVMIERISQRIKNAGKKYYVFVVGKPNVAKLANFESVELWCVLGCDHQGIIVDQYNEYYRPIVTPYELLLALEDDLSWTGKWETDFNYLLEMMDGSDQTPTATEDEDEDEDAPPDFDSVTGKYVSLSRPLRRLQHLTITSTDSEGETALVKKLTNTTVSVRDTVSTSAMHLRTRHWSGLGSDFTQDGSDEEDKDNMENGALLEEGAAGIARGYDHDASEHA